MPEHEALEQEFDLLQYEIDSLGRFSVTRDDDGVTVAHDEGTETLWLIGGSFAVLGIAAIWILDFSLGVWPLAAGLAVLGFACARRRKHTVVHVTDGAFAANLTFRLRRMSGLPNEDRRREFVTYLRLCRGSSVTLLPSVWDRMVRRGA